MSHSNDDEPEPLFSIWFRSHDYKAKMTVCKRPFDCRQRQRTIRRNCSPSSSSSIDTSKSMSCDWHFLFCFIRNEDLNSYVIAKYENPEKVAIDRVIPSFIGIELIYRYNEESRNRYHFWGIQLRWLQTGPSLRNNKRTAVSRRSILEQNGVVGGFGKATILTP